jgi:ribosomal protein S17E
LFGVMYQKDRFIRLVRLIKRFNNNLKKKYREQVRLAIYTNTKMCQDVSDLISQYCL